MAAISRNDRIGLHLQLIKESVVIKQMCDLRELLVRCFIGSSHSAKLTLKMYTKNAHTPVYILTYLDVNTYYDIQKIHHYCMQLDFILAQFF